MRNFKEILDLLGEMKAQLRIDDPMNHYDKIIEIEKHLLADQNEQSDLVGYIHKDDLEKLLSDNAGNHLTVGIDTRQAWPTGPGESKPYDWLVAVYTRPAQAAQPPSAQSWELDEESCKFLADMITADPDQITRVGFHLGYAKDDLGNLVHSFSVYETEYPEEGVHPLVETKLNQPVQSAGAQEPVQPTVEFGIAGEKIFFQIGNQRFALNYEPNEKEEAEDLAKMLTQTFSTLTHGVKTARPAQQAVNERLLAVCSKVYSLCLSGNFYDDHDGSLELLRELRAAIEAAEAAKGGV